MGIVDRRPDFQTNFQPIIKRLITIVQDKIGNKRKSAAILLAKLARNPQNK
jgi:hypothetical protein